MPYLKEENDYWRTPEFLNFTNTAEYRVLKFLMAHIVRETKGYNAPTGAIMIHRKYFLKGLLCASYGMNNIAKIFNWFSKGKPNKGYVSRVIKKLEKIGLLKIHKIGSPVGVKYVYQLGYYEGTYGQEDYKETLFFDIYFSRLALNQKKKLSDKKSKKLYDSMSPELRKYFDDLNIKDQPEKTYNRETITPVVKYPKVVIPAKAGIQKETGCRIKSGMTELAI